MQQVFKNLCLFIRENGSFFTGPLMKCYHLHVMSVRVCVLVGLCVCVCVCVFVPVFVCLFVSVCVFVCLLFFVCSYCGKNVQNKKNLQAHIHIHTGTSGEHCSYYEKNFKNKNSLQVTLTVRTSSSA